MIFGGIQRTSCIDFPKHLSCVLFTAGCDYDCFYCHNRQLLHGGASISTDEVMSFLQSRRGLLDAVVISGGEPTIHGNLFQFVSDVVSMGFLVKLDTNGGHPQVVAQLLDARLLSYVALDVKAPWERYQEICHASPEPVAKTLDLLQSSDVPWEARTTVAPTLGPADLMAIAAVVPTGIQWRLNRYRIPSEYQSADAQRILAPALDLDEVLIGQLQGVHTPIVLA